MVEGFGQLGLHAGDLGWGGAAVEAAHVVAAQRGVADERRNIHARPGRIHSGGPCGEGRIAEIFGRAKQVHGVRRCAVHSEWRGADAAVAGNDSRDALRKLGQHLRMADDGEVVVRVDIDESWGEGKAAGIDDLHRAEREGLTDGGDAAAGDREIQ